MAEGIDLLRLKLNQRLFNHVRNVDLEQLSRVPISRLMTTALPNIKSVELVSGDVFALHYDAMYVSMFPRQTERELSDLIVQRLKADFAGTRTGLAHYRIVGIRDQQGAAIGAAHFSVLRLPGTAIAVPYLQYIYVRTQNRRQDMAEVLHLMVLAVASADALQEGRYVPFTLFETEPSNYGNDDETRAIAKERIHIHAKAGAVALMVRDPNGVISSPHVQPGLQVGDPPVTLVWAVRDSPTKHEYNIQTVGTGLMAAYYQSIRDEGFPEANIQVAEDMVRQICEGSVFCSVPL